MTGKPTDPVARFWSKVEKGGPVVSELGPCWRWQGTPHKSGYGRFSPTPGAIVYVHRYSYELNVGPIPEGLQLDHLCRNTMCVRPEHLEAVTQHVNAMRSMSPTAVNARKTQCPKGHPLSGDNAYVHTVKATGTPARRCKACNTEKAREYRARLAAKRVAA